MHTSPSEPDAALKDEYTSLLVRFNWAFQIHALPEEEALARQQLKRMWALQQHLDAEGAIWRRYRPDYGPEPIAPLPALVASRNRQFP